jgi:hypothetical protein
MAFFDDVKSRFGTRKFVSQVGLSVGKIVQFTYDNEQKYALVLNPSWQGKMHALSLKVLSEATLEDIIQLVDNESDADIIYSKFKTSKFVVDRPYRTYLLNKISALREIYIKAPSQPTGEPDGKPTSRSEQT